MNKKPYYNPKTKETYIYLETDGAVIKMFTGAWFMGDCKTGRPTRHYNQLGELIEELPVEKYVTLVNHEEDKNMKQHITLALEVVAAVIIISMIWWLPAVFVMLRG
jgi:calcineurin-like phosphoesterase family protein